MHFCSGQLLRRHGGGHHPIRPKKLEIIQELTGKQRDRVYVYAKYIAIMNKGNDLP